MGRQCPWPRPPHIGYDTGMCRFFVHLEYHHDGEWWEVVRFDHDATGEVGHDVTEEGLHMDIYRDDEKIDSPEIFPPMPAIDAFTHAENHIASHAEQYINCLNNGTGSSDNR